MSKKKKENYLVIKEFCETKSLAILDKLTYKMAIVPTKIDSEKLKLSPSRSDHNSYSMEEDKN